MERANNLPESYRHRHLQSQAAPLVVDGNNLSGNGLSGGVAIFLQEFARNPPFQAHRILGKDDILVLIVEGHPFAAYLDLSGESARN